MAAKKKDIDRAALEVEYRAGSISIRTLSAQYGLSASRITQIADEEGWVRDLSKKIKARTESKLNSSILNTKLNAGKAALEREVVEANATMQADIIRAHRKDITRSRALSMALLSELEATTGDNELFKQLGELLMSPDDKGADKLNDIYKRVIAMPSRMDSMKKLAETLKTLIVLEREAFGIDKEGDGAAKSVADAIRAACGNS